MATRLICSAFELGLLLLSTTVLRTSSTNIQDRQFHPTPDAPHQDVSNNNFQHVMGMPLELYRLVHMQFRRTADPRFQGPSFLRAYCRNHRMIRLNIVNGYSEVYCVKDRSFLSRVMLQLLPGQGLTDGKIAGWYAADSVLHSFGHVPICVIRCSEGSRPELPPGNYSRPMHDRYFSVGCGEIQRNTGQQGVFGPFCRGICRDDIYEVQNGRVFCNADTQVGSTCSIQCDTGYVSVGPDANTCGVTKQWHNTEKFRCLPSDVGYAVRNLIKNEGLSVSEALKDLRTKLQKYVDEKTERSPSTRREVLRNTQEEMTEAEILKLVKKLLAQLSDSSPATLKHLNTCSVSPKDRRDCGYGGITPGECRRRGCCFDSSRDQTIWCFYKSSDIRPLNYTTKTTTKYPSGFNRPIFHNPPAVPRHPSLPPFPEIFPTPHFQQQIEQRTTPSTIPNPGQPDVNEDECGCVPRQVARCLSMPPLARVMCGRSTTAEDWPWHAIVNYGKEFCGGTLIARNFVLTAAHCLTSPGTADSSSFNEVYFGVTDRKVTDERNGIQIRKMKRVIRHEGFEFRSMNHVVNDIALIELSEPVTYSRTVKPLCLPGRARTAINKNCYITGFGRTHPSSPSPSFLLQTAHIPMTYDRSCSAAYSSFRPGQNICAGTHKSGSPDACKGDSGGPLACQAKAGDGCSWYLAGVTSFGIEPCGSGTPGVYMNVSHYEPWIKSHIRSHRVW